jgi:hypothetical protein
MPVTAFLGTRFSSGVIPHGGGAVAILIASIWIAVIPAIVALEQGHSTRVMFGWMLAAFAVVFVLISAVVYLSAR